MSRLSINEQGASTSPNLTSHTPPPPGFDSAPPPGADITRSETPKSTSFNNLAMALGTGLAESMDAGMDDQRNNLAAIPQRTFTPDNYTRQSRHSVSRLMGSSGAGGGKTLIEFEERFKASFFSLLDVLISLRLTS